jgi:flagellar secretion chaperone FliS
MTSPHPRDRYLQDSINTASPGTLVVMLYDRLVRDLTQGEEALRNNQREQSHELLMHAQDIVLELRTTLDVESWEGAPALADLYGFILMELIKANINREPDRVASCRTLIEPLRDAWREAVASAVAG